MMSKVAILASDWAHWLKVITKNTFSMCISLILSNTISFILPTSELKRAAANVDEPGYHPSDNTAPWPTSPVAKYEIDKSFAEISDEAKGWPVNEFSHKSVMEDYFYSSLYIQYFLLSKVSPSAIFWNICEHWLYSLLIWVQWSIVQSIKHLLIILNPNHIWGWEVCLPVQDWTK